MSRAKSLAPSYIERVTFRAGAAAGLESAGVAIGLAGPVPIGVVRWNLGVIDAQAPSMLLELLAGRAAVKVGGVIVGEIGA